METPDKNFEVTKLIKEIVSQLKHNRGKAVKSFENSGLTLPQGFLIEILAKNGSMKINELSRQLSLSNSTVSGIIDRLEKREIVERIRSKEDKRVVHVSLTPKFEETYRGFHNMFDKIIENVLSKGTPEEIEEIIRGLNVLKKLLNEPQEAEG